MRVETRAAAAGGGVEGEGEGAGGGEEDGEEDGVTVEAFWKPRVTQNSSHGQEDSVNAGVPVAERVVALPALHKQKKPSQPLGELTQNPAETL